MWFLLSTFEVKPPLSQSCSAPVALHDMIWWTIFIHIFARGNGPTSEMKRSSKRLRLHSCIRIYCNEARVSPPKKSYDIINPTNIASVPQREVAWNLYQTHVQRVVFGPTWKKNRRGEQSWWTKSLLNRLELNILWTHQWFNHSNWFQRNTWNYSELFQLRLSRSCAMLFLVCWNDPTRYPL